MNSRTTDTADSFAEAYSIGRCSYCGRPVDTQQQLATAVGLYHPRCFDNLGQEAWESWDHMGEWRSDIERTLDYVRRVWRR